MKVFNVGGAAVMMYSGPKEMPVKRYNVFQKLLLLEAGIGSDMDAVNRHFGKLHGYIAADMKKESAREAENLHFNIYAVLNGLDFKTNTFACLVSRIGEAPCTDISDEGLARTSAALLELGITVADVESAVDEVKKKMSEELSLYFPRIFAADETLQFYASLKQQVEHRARLILGELDEAGQAELAKLDRYFLNLNKPQNFRPDDPENVLIEMDLQFAQLCALLDSEGAGGSAVMSTFDFYARMDWIMQRNKPAPVS